MPSVRVTPIYIYIYIYIYIEERRHLCLEERQFAAIGGLNDGNQPRNGMQGLSQRTACDRFPV